MADPPGAALDYEIRIAAPAEEVFAHFTDPRRLIRWLGRHAVIDPRPGGAWSIDVNGRDVVAGTYTAVEPFTRLEFTWAWRTASGEDAAYESRVEVTFREEGGETVVKLRHHGLPGGLRDAHDGGWRHYLDRLATASAGGDPGPDPLGTPDTRHASRSPSERD
jgi:uncharacterized protein YndB with AHSA1/START domain